MVIVDTSVWVDHFRRGNRRLTSLLEEGAVALHPFVIGELACGNLKNRQEVLSLLRALPRVGSATDEEGLDFTERNKLMGKGLGWIDVHLLASAVLAGVPLWALDRRLTEAAARLGIAADA